MGSGVQDLGVMGFVWAFICGRSGRLVLERKLYDVVIGSYYIYYIPC